MEKWKSISDYEGLYLVSKEGEIKSLGKGDSNNVHHKKERILVQMTNHCGYQVVNLSKNGKTKQFRVNRIVSIHFVENPDNKPEVHHLDEIKSNNRASNLKWVTSQENVDYSNSKEVLQMDMFGNIVHTWKSTAEAGRKGFDKGHISKCCLGKRKTHKKHQWSYAGN